jgi:membrane protein
MRSWSTRLFREIRDDGLFDAAASVAFWILLSLPAALLAGLSSVSLLGDGLTADLRRVTLEFIERVFTTEADTLADSVNDLFDQQRSGVLSISIAVAIFTVSRGFAGLIRALDTVYDIEERRNFIHTRALAIGLAVGTLAVIALSTALWSFGADRDVPILLRLAIAGAVLIAWSATVFHIGPNHHTPWRYDLPGAVFTTIGWLALSIGFGWYVRLLGGAGTNDVLGAAGALLLALTWLWGACTVLLIGGEINEMLASRAGVVSDSRTIVDVVRHLRSTGDGASTDDGDGASTGDGDAASTDDGDGASTDDGGFGPASTHAADGDPLRER